MNDQFHQGNVTGCPCYLCEERYEACHGYCERYRAWRGRMDEKKNAEKTISTMSRAKEKSIWRKQRYSTRNFHRRGGNE